mgnify:CR=1 FL=1
MYQVNIKHFYMVEYIENGKVMNVEVDLRESIVQIGIICIHNWNPPDENIVLDQQQKYHIAQNIKEYLEIKKGMRCEIV